MVKTNATKTITNTISLFIFFLLNYLNFSNFNLGMIIFNAEVKLKNPILGYCGCVEIRLKDNEIVVNN